jgi:hypothetical protein
VAAIEAVNALTGDVSAAQRGRYDRSEAGLSRLIADFYSYAIDKQGRPAVPLGSHAGPNTAGAISEGGYLGFAGLQYVHTPLPGESLVAFLSDGAFEEQRGSDWAPRWWRAEDCGFAIPVMILNGRRIEQRTQIVQEGGATWLAEDLRHNGFDPVIVDGRDPMAIAWAIVEAEDTLSAFAARSDRRYPVKLPYVIAETEKVLASGRGDQCRPQPAAGRQSARGCTGTRGLQCRGCGAVRAGDRTGKRAHRPCESRPEPALARKRAPHGPTPSSESSSADAGLGANGGIGQRHVRTGPLVRGAGAGKSTVAHPDRQSRRTGQQQDGGHTGAAQAPRQRARTRRPGIDGWLGGHRTQ